MQVKIRPENLISPDAANRRLTEAEDEEDEGGPSQTPRQQNREKNEEKPVDEAASSALGTRLLWSYGRFYSQTRAVNG